MKLLQSGEGLQNAVLAITKHLNGLRMQRNSQNRDKINSRIKLQELVLIKNQRGETIGLKPL